MARPAAASSHTKSRTPVSSPSAPAPKADPEGLKLVVYPAPVLKKRAQEVTAFDDWLKAVADKMKKIMVDQHGVGLAAPQVGLGIRLLVWSPEGTLEGARTLVNPVFSNEHGQEEGEEGCLSLPDIRTKVVRFKSLHVEAQDENGQPVAMDLEDYPARIVQHETDHLDGVLLLDRMGPVAKLANRRKIKELEERAGVKPKK